MIKIRPDINFFRSKGLAMEEFSHVRPGEFYSRSDFAFYADTATFLHVMGDFYPTAVERYLDHGDVYFPLNFTSILKSDSVVLQPTDERERQRLIRYAPKSMHVDLMKKGLRTGCVTSGFVYPCRLSSDIRSRNVAAALIAHAEREERCQDQVLVALSQEEGNATKGRAVGYVPGQRKVFLRKWNETRQPNNNCGKLLPKGEVGGDRNLPGQLFCNLNVSSGPSNARFSSEKYFPLHVLSRAPLKRFMFPLLGKNLVKVRDLPLQSVIRLNISDMRKSVLRAEEVRNLTIYKEAARSPPRLDGLTELPRYVAQRTEQDTK
jgi:hypothetical protein